MINTSTLVGKVAFSLVCNSKSSEFLNGNSKLLWDRLVNKYALYSALPLLKLKSKFHNSKLDLVENIQMSRSQIWNGFKVA